MAEAVRMLGSAVMIAALVAGLGAFVWPFVSAFRRRASDIDGLATAFWLRYFAVFGGLAGFLLYIVGELAK